MGGNPWRVTRLAIATMVAGAVLSAPWGTAAPRRVDPTAVIALLDTGINPYHVEFRDRSPRAMQHPSTYLPGFPRSAVALRLTLDERDYAKAVEADCERVWSEVQPGELYWFPGTKIVGAISFGAGGGPCPGGPSSGPRVLDISGHGTMTASRAVANTYGACRSCRIVMVQGLGAGAEGVEWMTDNSTWIDVQSHSWGPILPAWEPVGVGGIVASSPRFVRALEAGARTHPSFWATGNGIATRGGVLGHPTTVDPRATPSVLFVGGHDSGYVTAWTDAPPNVVADACSARAAHHDHTAESTDTHSIGTSGATPYAAGAAAQILLETRRLLGWPRTGVHKGVAASGRRGSVRAGPLADGVFALDEWRAVLQKTANPRPVGTPDDGPPCDVSRGSVIYTPLPVKWADVPAGVPEYLQIGYGAISRDTVAHAIRIVRGLEPMPDRATTDEFFAREALLRAAAYEVWSKP